MLTLYSYPDLLGCADNNPFGLKVWAFLKMCGLPFRHQQILDASKAPRASSVSHGRDTVVGDSDAIIAYLISRHALRVDAGLTAAAIPTCSPAGSMKDGWHSASPARGGVVFGQFLPASNGADAKPGLVVIGNEREVATQLDDASQLTSVLASAADRFGCWFIDGEHAGTIRPHLPQTASPFAVRTRS